jgi:hypothetical protein
MKPHAADTTDLELNFRMEIEIDLSNPTYLPPNFLFEDKMEELLEIMTTKGRKVIRLASLENASDECGKFNGCQTSQKATFINYWTVKPGETQTTARVASPSCSSRVSSDALADLEDLLDMIEKALPIKDRKEFSSAIKGPGFQITISTGTKPTKMHHKVRFQGTLTVGDHSSDSPQYHSMKTKMSVGQFKCLKQFVEHTMHNGNTNAFSEWVKKGANPPEEIMRIFEFKDESPTSYILPKSVEVAESDDQDLELNRVEFNVYNGDIDSKTLRKYVKSCLAVTDEASLDNVSVLLYRM